MLTKVSIALALIISAKAYALSPVCDQAARQASLKAANEAYGLQSESSRHVTDSKLLFHGRYLDTYVVFISDEVEPSDWLVVLDQQCHVRYTGLAGEGLSTP